MTRTNYREGRLKARSPEGETAGPMPGRTLAWVAIIAVATHALSLAGTRLWVYPDSIDYILLAGGIAERFDLAQELFLVRPPGYPLLVAGVFAVFQTASPLVLALLQHAMAVATVTLTAAIAWRLTSSRVLALVTGILGACSLQSLAYANLLLTETPFALLLVACVYCLIRFLPAGRWRWLALASAAAGGAYLFRPIGLHLLGASALAALMHAWQRSPGGIDRLGRPAGLVRLGIGGMTAIGPALLVASPWMLKNAFQHDSLQGARCLDYVLYLRAVEFDRLDSATSAAMNDIHEVVDEAIARGELAPDASFRDRATVIEAYRKVRGAPFAASSRVMGEAGRNIMDEHKLTIAMNTLRYAYWMLLSPDPVYRFVPGGASGIDGQKDAEAAFFDIGTYSVDGAWDHVLERHRRYLPLSTEPRIATPVIGASKRVYRDYIDDAPAPLGLLDSPYEQWMVFIMLSGLMTLMTRRRNEWLLVATVIALHVSVSAFLGGPQTRYLLPVRTLLLMYGAFGLCAVAAAVAPLILGARRVSSKSVPGHA